MHHGMCIVQVEKLAGLLNENALNTHGGPGLKGSAITSELLILNHLNFNPNETLANS